MSIGERVSWKSINKDYTGIVTGFFRDFAVVRIDGSSKSVLLQNKQSKICHDITNTKG